MYELPVLALFSLTTIQLDYSAVLHILSLRELATFSLSLSTVPETVRLENLQIVELWLSRETIPPEETLDPQNGKFSVVIRTMRYSYGRLTVLFGVQDQTYFTKID